MSGPVAAATPPASDYGNTVECRYTAGGHGPAYDFKLRRFVVKPPVLYANKSHQVIGWRFIVTRSIFEEGEGPWKVTYRSPIDRAAATPTTSASFDAQSVDVALPNIENPRAAGYHITLKFYWYRADGSVASRQTYVMPWLKVIQNGHYEGEYDDICWSGFYEGP